MKSVNKELTTITEKELRDLLRAETAKAGFDIDYILLDVHLNQIIDVASMYDLESEFVGELSEYIKDCLVYQQGLAAYQIAECLAYYAGKTIPATDYLFED